MTSEFTLFPNLYSMFTKIDQMLDCKTNHIEFKRIQILQSIFSEHNGSKLEINNNSMSKKSPNVRKLTYL